MQKPWRSYTIWRYPFRIWIRILNTVSFGSGFDPWWWVKKGRKSVLHSFLRFCNNFAIIGKLWDITSPPPKKNVSHQLIFTFALLSDLVWRKMGIKPLVLATKSPLRPSKSMSRPWRSEQKGSF
jgi:hypothetical protein